MRVEHYAYMNSRPVPVRAEGESKEDFEARMAWYREHDRRIPVHGHGVCNFGFGVSFNVGGGVLGYRGWRPVEKVVDGYGTGEFAKYEPSTRGGWSSPEKFGAGK